MNAMRNIFVAAAIVAATFIATSPAQARTMQKPTAEHVTREVAVGWAYGLWVDDQTIDRYNGAADSCHRISKRRMRCTATVTLYYSDNPTYETCTAPVDVFYRAHKRRPLARAYVKKAKCNGRRLCPVVDGEYTCDGQSGGQRASTYKRRALANTVPLKAL